MSCPVPCIAEVGGRPQNLSKKFTTGTLYIDMLHAEPMQVPANGHGDHITPTASPSRGPKAPIMPGFPNPLLASPLLNPNPLASPLMPLPPGESAAPLLNLPAGSLDGGLGGVSGLGPEIGPTGGVHPLLQELQVSGAEGHPLEFGDLFRKACTLVGDMQDKITGLAASDSQVDDRRASQEQPYSGPNPPDSPSPDSQSPGPPLPDESLPGPGNHLSGEGGRDHPSGGAGGSGQQALGVFPPGTPIPEADGVGSVAPNGHRDAALDSSGANQGSDPHAAPSKRAEDHGGAQKPYEHMVASQAAALQDRDAEDGARKAALQLLPMGLR